MVVRTTLANTERYTRGQPPRPTPRAEAPAALLAPGTLLQDTYRIEGVIASGGMGDVYRATHERLEGSFAIKVLHRDLLSEGDLLARFRTEAKIMAGLHHPHIVQVFDFNFTPDGTPYLAMELAEGSDLRNVTANGRRLSPVRVSEIVSQIASALGAAHAHGVVHRDLKPENVMLVPMEDDSVCVKVVDFGVSKTRNIPHITVEPTLIGTPEFMAPEQAQGYNEHIDHRTDQFALGTLAYFMLTGHEPFRGTSPVAVLYQVVHEEAPALRGFVTWPSARVDAVIRRAMAKDRERRYPSILDFARALEDAVVADVGVGAADARCTPLPRRIRRLEANDACPGFDYVEVSHSSRRPWRMAMVVLAAVCVATVLLGSGSKTGLDGPRVAGVYRSFTDQAARLVARVRAASPAFASPLAGREAVR